MQVLFVSRFYYSDKMDKIDRLIHASSSETAVKMSSVVKQLLYVLNCFELPPAGCIRSFRIRSKETLRIVYPKYPVLDMIQRIHLRCGSFGSIIRFWILVKKRNIRFRIKNPDLDFSQETHLCSASTGVSQSNFSSSHTSDKVSANWTECCKK